MWKVIEKEQAVSVAEMERFVRTHPKCHFMQSPQWAAVKTFWDWRGILVYREGALAGTLSVLIRPLPLGLSLLYAPRGPVCDRNDRHVIEELLAGVKEIATKHRALLLYMDPDELDSNREFRAILTDLGFREKADDGFGNIQPQYVFRLSLSDIPEEDLFRSFSSKTRYNIGLARRRGVTIREYSGANPVPKEVLDRFCEMMEQTGARDHFRVRGKAYFEGLLGALGDDARLFVACYQGELIAGSIEVFYGNKAWYLYGASSNAHRNAMPNYLLQWTMIRSAMERGCDVYDFRGVPGNPSEDGPLYGLYRFKKGFSGVYTKFTGLFAYSFRPIGSTVFLKMLQLRRMAGSISNICSGPKKPGVPRPGKGRTGHR